MSLGSDDVKRVDEPACDICVVCHDLLDDKDPHRTLVKLKACRHQFHLDCIGSEFNAKNKMICPTCRNVEQGRWLFARQQNEDPNDLIEIEEEGQYEDPDDFILIADERQNQDINTIIQMEEERQNHLRVNSSWPLTGGLTTAPVWDQPHNPARSTSSLWFPLDDTLQRQEIQQQIELSVARVRAANEELHGFYSSTRQQESYLSDDWMERLMARNRPDNEQYTNRMMYGFDMRGSYDVEDGSNSHEYLGFRSESSLAYTRQQVLQRWTERTRAANEQHMNRTMYDFAMRRINDIEDGINSHESLVFRNESSLAPTRAANDMRRNNSGEGGGSSRWPWQS